MTLPSFVASSTVDMGAGGNGTSVVLTRPSAWTSGLTAYVGIYKENSASVTPPSGWVELTGSPFNAGTSFWAHVFRKVLGGSEPSSYTWSWTGSTWREGVGLAVQDTDQTTPEDQISGQGNSSSQTITAPAVTPTVANTLLVVLGFYFNDSNYTSNTGMTERVDFGNRAITMATETGPASGVSSGTNTFTATAASSVNVGITIAVQEVQSGGTTHNLTGSSAGVATVAGMLQKAWSLVASSAGAATVSATLSATGTFKNLVGSSAGIAAVAATLGKQRNLVASSAGIATVAGTLLRGKLLTASSAGVSTVTGTLGKVRSLVGSSAGAATVTGTITRTIRLVATSAAVATVSGTLDVQQMLQLFGSAIAGVASVSATLQRIAFGLPTRSRTKVSRRLTGDPAARSRSGGRATAGDRITSTLDLG